jgi:hypothetical protein
MKEETYLLKLLLAAICTFTAVIIIAMFVAAGYL